MCGPSVELERTLEAYGRTTHKSAIAISKNIHRICLTARHLGGSWLNDPEAPDYPSREVQVQAKRWR